MWLTHCNAKPLMVQIKCPRIKEPTECPAREYGYGINGDRETAELIEKMSELPEEESRDVFSDKWTMPL